MGEQREVIGLHHKHGCVYGLFFGVTNATALSETNYWRFNCVNSLMFLLFFFGGGFQVTEQIIETRFLSMNLCF